MLTDAADREGQMDFSLPYLEIALQTTLEKDGAEHSDLPPHSCSSPHSSLEVQPAKPHVAHVHMAMLFTNTLLGVPRYPWVPHCCF